MNAPFASLSVPELDSSSQVSLANLKSGAQVPSETPERLLWPKRYRRPSRQPCMPLRMLVPKSPRKLSDGLPTWANCQVGDVTTSGSTCTGCTCTVCRQVQGSSTRQPWPNGTITSIESRINPACHKPEQQERKPALRLHTKTTAAPAPARLRCALTRSFPRAQAPYGI